MEYYTFYDFEAKPTRSGRYIHFSKTNKLCLSRVSKNIAKEIEQKRLTKCRVRRDNITGEICLVFNKDKGAQVSRNTNGIFIRGGEKFYDFFRAMFDIDGQDTFNLNLSENKSNSDEFLTYVVSK